MKVRIFLLVSLIAAIFYTCDDDGDSFDVGNVFIDNQAVIGYVDSFTLQLSTIRLDSFITMGNTDIFLGSFNDKEVGNVHTEVYVPINFARKTNVSEDAVYDSMIVCFKPNGIWVGDTITPREVKIYEVFDEIKPLYTSLQQSMFNNQRLSRGETELATVSLNPGPLVGDVSWARMSDSVGHLWFNMLKNSDDVMDKNEYFEEFFRGICIVPQTTDYTWGLGFISQSDVALASYEKKIEDAGEFEIRLYYHESGDDEDGSYMKFIAKRDNSYQYTYFENDRSGTPFENLEIDGDRVSSSKSGNKAYIQTGSGLALRIDFPSLSVLRSASEYMAVMDARLIIRPKDYSFDETYALPSTLYLDVSDESNDLLSNLTDLSGNIVSSPIYYSPETGQPFYAFSLLRFVRSRVLSVTDDTELALIVLPSDNENSTAFRRLVVDDNSAYAENVQLMVYYITY